MSDPRNTFYSDAEIEARWGRKPGYLAELRAGGGGPKFTKLSPRVTRTRGDHLLEYEDSRVFANNAEALAAGDGDGDGDRDGDREGDSGPFEAA